MKKLTTEESERYREDPVAFAREILGVDLPPTQTQLEIYARLRAGEQLYVPRQVGKQRLARALKTWLENQQQKGGK